MDLKMKKIYLISGVILALATMSCNKENAAVETPSGTVLKAVIGTDDTKAAHTRYKDVVWSAGDALAVYNGSDFTQFSLTDGDGTTSGTFTASSDVTPTGFAVYPYAEVKSYDGSKNVTLTLPAEYTWAEQSLNAPMLALVSGSDLATFKQLCGYFKIDVDNLPATASKLVFFTEEQVITGDFKVDVTSAWPGIYSWNVSNEWDRAKRTVTVNFTAGEKASRTFYIPVPGGDYTKFKVSIQNAGGTDLLTPKTWTSSGSPVTIDKGTLKALPAISASSVSEMVTELWKGSVTTGNYANSVTALSYRADGLWSEAEAGDIIRIHYSGSGESNVKVSYVDTDYSWKDLDGTNWDYYAATGDYQFNYTLSAEGLGNLSSKNGMVISAANATITQVDLVKSVATYRPESIVWTGYAVLGKDVWEYNLTDLEASFWAGVTAGKVLTIYHEEIDQTANWRQLQLQYTSPSWTTIKSWGFNACGSLSHSYTLTADDITHLKAGGAAINGVGLAITKITLR